MKFVAAGRGNHIDDATQCPAEFRLVTAGFDFNLLHKVIRQIGACGAQVRIGHVDAIDEIGVFRPRAARDVHLIISAKPGKVTEIGLRHQGGNGAKVTLHRQQVEGLELKIRTNGSGVRIYNGPFAADHDSG